MLLLANIESVTANGRIPALRYAMIADTDIAAVIDTFSLSICCRHACAAIFILRFTSCRHISPLRHTPFRYGAMLMLLRRLLSLHFDMPPLLAATSPAIDV